VDRVARGYGLVRGRTGTERRKPGTAGEPVYSDQWDKERLTLIPEKTSAAHCGRRGVARLSHPTILVHPYLVIRVTGWRKLSSTKIETLEVSAPGQSYPKMMRLTIQGAVQINARHGPLGAALTPDGTGPHVAVRPGPERGSGRGLDERQLTAGDVSHFDYCIW
jgi:hypothetical protein